MPELPEVETLRHELNLAIKGKTIKNVSIDFAKMVRPLSVGKFQKSLAGQKILDVARRAKVLILKLSNGEFLVVHLKLTGQLIYSPTPTDPVSSPSNRRATGSTPPRASASAGQAGGDNSRHLQRGGLDNLPNKFTHAIFNFTDGSKLYFNDLRKFGWIRLVNKLEVDKLIGEFGMEPLSAKFKLAEFKKILGRYPKRKVKQILLSQRLISGIGNIYADESCFCAKIQPMRAVENLSEPEIRRLFSCIPKILKFAINKKGTSADTYLRTNGEPGEMLKYLKVYGRKGEKCRRCGGMIKKIKLNGRGTHYCSRCQR